MKYGSVSQILEDKQRTFDALKRAVMSLSAPQSTHRISEGQWTIGEILEHMVLVESRLLRLVNVSSHKLEKSADRSQMETGLDIEIPDGTENNDFFKVKTQPQYEPTGTASPADSIAKLQTIHDNLRDLRPLLERIDLNAVSFDHWLLGTLTIGQWLAFIGIHEQRHLGQIQSILASATFPN